MNVKRNIIRPQKGYQMKILSTPADIAIGGGAAGCGKTFGLLLEPLRHIEVSNFRAVFFRRTYKQIKNAGGLWDSATQLYSQIKTAQVRESAYQWVINPQIKARVEFSHLEYEKNIYDWQGAEIPLLCFDELTHFSSNMFFYLLSRNRSTCGVKPYVRATCNPDPDSWVAEFISWWIDQDTGYPIPERQGKLRYFVRDGNTFIWGNTKAEVIEKAKYYLEPMIQQSNELVTYDDYIKSVTFIGGNIYENQKLLSIDPGYLGNLASQSEEERERLLGGNWKVVVSANDVYDYHSFRDIFNNSFVERGDKRIIVDVAMEGDDKLMIGYFEGYRLEDLKIVPKSTGKDVIDEVTGFQNIHKVKNSSVLYDADGVGSFIGGETNGFIQGAVPFKNGSKAIEKQDDKRSFFNLKTQCYIYSGERVGRGESYISEKVANMMYDEQMTVKQRLMLERKAIKKQPQKDEEAIRLIKKEEMKQKYLNGSSPDILDMFMMNEFFDLKPNRKCSLRIR